MTDRRSLTVLGVTGSGKSTWIGALAEALSRGYPSRIKFDDENWPEDTIAIDRAREYLQTGAFPLHTNEEMRSLIELPIQIVRGVHLSETFTLKISDYDGELIEKLFRERTQGWDDAWRRRARSSSFLLLLRHDFTKSLRKLRRPPERKATRASVREDPLIAQSPDDLVGSPLGRTPLPETPALKEEDSRYVPTSLALVELLQWIRREHGLLPGQLTPADAPLRVGVVLTAWDAVEKRWVREAPEEFLSAHHALLKDFLACNFREEEVRVFALSATGGNLADAAYREKYLATETPLSKVWWKAPSGGVMDESDLAIPVCWALYGEGGIAR